MFERCTKRPVWVLDSQASACSKCLSAFGALKRKHHCRQCGCIFCNECCSSREMLPHLKYDTLERVCKCCHDINTYINLAETAVAQQNAMILQQRSEQLYERGGLTGNTDGLSGDSSSAADSSSSFDVSAVEVYSDVASSAQGFASLTLDGQCQIKMVEQCCLPILIAMLSEINTPANRHITHALSNISKNAANRLKMIESGVLEALFPLLWDEEGDSEVQLNICAVLEGLACLEHEEVNKRLLQPGLDLIVHLSRCTDLAIRMSAAAILRNLAYNEISRDALVEHQGVEALISLALMEDPQIQVRASKALARIAEYAKHQRAVAQAGALMPLLLQLESPSQDVHEHAAMALANLAENSENQAKIVGAGGVRSLFSLLPSKNPRVLQNATKALANLSVHPESHSAMSDVEVVSSLIQIAIIPAQPILQVSAIACLAKLASVPNVALRMKENKPFMEILKPYASDPDSGKTHVNALIIQQAVADTKDQRLSRTFPLRSVRNSSAPPAVIGARPT